MRYIQTLARGISRQSIAKFRLKLFRPFLAQKYIDYDSEDFVEGLERIGILPGDPLFLMCSQDQIYLKTGKLVPVQSMLKDLMAYLGEESTVMALCFPVGRDQISAKKKIFNAKKTATESGMLAEILRRKKGSVRSLNPIFSAVSYGRKAHLFSDSHHLSPYPFGPLSPYYQMMSAGGKYLGIGVGFEAFTPCHMIEDHFKKRFKHTIYYEEPEEFTVQSSDGCEQQVSTFMRNPETFPKGGYDPIYYFNLLDISNSQTLTRSGVKLFTFKIQDFFDAAVHIYESKRVTVWDTGSLIFNLSKATKQLLRKALKS